MSMIEYYKEVELYEQIDWAWDQDKITRQLDEAYKADEALKIERSYII